MPPLISPCELPKWVRGKILSASDTLGWKEVGQRTYRYGGQDVALPGIDHFTIVRYCARELLGVALAFKLLRRARGERRFRLRNDLVLGRLVQS